jgi:serine/threonine protein phosphatase 1
LDLIVSYGGYAFVHAGARSGVALDQQDEHDLMWIRDEFLYGSRPFEKVIVHGHTPSEQPHLDQRRIGIDTGAYATGVLTAVRLMGADRRILQSTLSSGRPGADAQAVST